MAVNLLDMLQSGVGKELVGQAGAYLGESGSTVQTGVNTLLPNLLGAVMHQGSTPQGASQLLGLLNSPSVDSQIGAGGLAGLFAGGNATSNLISAGTSQLSSLFGTKVGALSDAVAGVSGLKSASATSLLAMATPFVLGLLKQHVQAGNLNASGLSDLLASQKANLGGGLSDKIFGALGLGSVAALVGGLGSGVAHAAGAAGAAAGNVVGSVASGVGNVAGAAANTAGAAVGAVGNAAGAVGGAAVGAAAAVGGAALGAAKGAAAMAGNAVDATADGAAAVGGGLMKWLPWLIGAAIVALLLSFCMKKTPDAPPAPAPAPVAAPAPAPAPEPASAPAPAAAPVAAIPDPVKVYFATGKTDLGADFGDKSKALVDYLKANASAKVNVAGFNDPRGNAAANAELAKNRAKNVAAALEAAGVSHDAIVMQKPADATDNGGNLDEARRVELSVAQ